MKTTISNFHTSFKIPEIQKLDFHIPHIQIIGTNHCGDSCITVYKRRKSFQIVLCFRDYADKVVVCFAHQYNHNIMVEIYLCLLMVLHWNIPVHYHRQK